MTLRAPRPPYAPTELGRHFADRPKRRPSRRRCVGRARTPGNGFTLVELLVAMTITIIVVTAIALVFNRAGQTISQGRAALEISGELRAAQHRLREDLLGHTAPVRPMGASDAPLGYVEIVEGPRKDWDADANTVADVGQVGAETTRGDVDDALFFTARSEGEPFTGRFAGAPIESELAEIAWWTVTTPNPSGQDETVLYRRALLIRPDLNNPATGSLPGVAANNLADLALYYQTNDVSVRLDGAGGVIANSLADLTQRENRFGHNPGVFPFPIDPAFFGAVVQTGTEQGQDVILSHLLAFDVRVFDPFAPVTANAPISATSRALVPGDPGYPGDTNIGAGAFIDLAHFRPNNSRFAGPPDARSQMPAFLPVATYCTWSYQYERDGIDQNGNSIVDEGTNGIDDDGFNGVDDPAESETSAPYPVPLRGISVTLRVEEHDRHVVRQSTMRVNFMPE